LPEAETTVVASNWPFLDPANVAVFTTRGPIVERKPIIYVSHNVDGGGNAGAI
jgi:hypothetical protein